MRGETEKKTIDKREYQFGRISPMKSMKLLVNIAQMIGGSLAGSVKDISGVKDILGSDMDIGTIISNLADKIDEDVFEELALKILQQTAYCHKDFGGLINSIEKYNTVFADTDVGHQFTVLKEALTVEYGSFFVERLGLGKVFKKVRAEQDMIQESSTETGSSGGQ